MKGEGGHFPPQNSEVFLLAYPGIISTTLVYPTRDRPGHGIFVQKRLAAVHRLLPLTVVAPKPWFPGIRPVANDMEVDASSVPPVVRPRMFYLPGVMKTWDARFYADALRAGIEASGLSDIDLIDAHFEWPDAVGAGLVARERGIPYVCTLRGKLVSQSRIPSRRGPLVEMLREAAAVISVSRSLADLACELAGRDLRVVVIPNGVDAETFYRTNEDVMPSTADMRARDALGWPRERRIVLSVGHIQKLKGFDRIVRCWPSVCRSVGDIELKLIGGDAGEPAYRTKLEAMIHDASKIIAPSGSWRPIELCGRQPQPRIAQMLNAADLFVLASESEGWCNSMAEALACGCPAVATDVGGNREVIAGPDCGILSMPDHQAALESDIVMALQRSWDRRRIAQYGGRRNWDDVAKACVRVLGRVCSAPLIG